MSGETRILLDPLDRAVLCHLI